MGSKDVKSIIWVLVIPSTLYRKANSHIILFEFINFEIVNEFHFK
jgi:hypothetical protein